MAKRGATVVLPRSDSDHHLMPLHNVPMKAPASDSGSEYDFLEDEDSENPNVFRIEGALPRPVKRDFTIEELHSRSQRHGSSGCVKFDPLD